MTPTPQQALDATKRTQYVDKDVVATMPAGTGEPIQFFKLDKYMTREEVEQEYERRGLVPASPIDLCAYDVAHPEEMDEKEYVVTIWGADCCLTFYRWDGERRVSCDRNDDDWSDGWFLAGSPGKSSALASSELPSETSDLDAAIAMVKAAGMVVYKVM